jgi:hypothetical protein
MLKGTGNVCAIAGSLAGPIFQGGRLLSNYRASYDGDGGSTSSSGTTASPRSSPHAAPDAHWLQLRLVGTSQPRRRGAGVRVVAGRKWQTRVVSAGSGYLSGSSLVQHFGRDGAERARRGGDRVAVGRDEPARGAACRYAA